MLFLRESKKILFSLTFLVYLVAVIAMYYVQFQGDCVEPLRAPFPNEDDYGMTAKEIPELLMPAATQSLVRNYLDNSYTAYPIGFYKNVRLNEDKKQKMADIITELSGLESEQLDGLTSQEEGGYEISIPPALTYERFRELMREADQLIGGGSDYSDDNIVNHFSRVPKTYEDALAEYEAFLNEDQVTNAYARLYCDYMGIVLAILPVFPAVSLAAADRKARMAQLIHSRKISSARLIFTRFSALVIMMLIPVAITAIFAQATVTKLYPNQSIDTAAIFKYAAAWLIPSVMTSTAAGLLITELTSSMLAIFAQVAWWFVGIFTGIDDLTGNIGKFQLVMRHNSLNDLDVFMDTYDAFVFNRVFFAAISLAAIAATALIYEQKRRGNFHEIHIRFKGSGNKSET